MKVALIGASGFIGSCLLRQLYLAGIEFWNFDLRQSSVSPERTTLLDIRDATALQVALKGFDTVCNLAAEHRDDVRPSSLYDEVNVQGARNLVKALQINGISNLLFTSSVSVYGFAPPDTGEDGEIAPFNDYGRTKWEAEIVYTDWAKGGPGRNLTIVRPTVVFGEGNRGNVYHLFNQIAKNKFVMIGKGRNIKSIAYVENVASFLVYCLERFNGVQIHNYVDKPDFSLIELVTFVREILGMDRKHLFKIPFLLAYPLAHVLDVSAIIFRKKFTLSAVRIKKFVSTTHFKTSPAALNSFHPSFTLKEGVIRTVQFEFNKIDPA